ncbi:VOC family protein [Pseudoflavitalea rhizosphaerae]|uniref:VOC family protein n=1 Tax=Pseudoflavitalea rhizosphaerae TaxID=1884793 RepID=UPI000F8D8A0E|nr:VOC family protein [Pseudoflavitalea rhizosphaerae]
MAKKIFINLPVADLKKSMEFYTKIGFTNNPAFTDETAACMVLSEEIYVMLLTHDKFSQFSSKKIIDARTEIGVINSISVDSAGEVNTMADTALKAGGSEPSSPKDYGFMQQRSFSDLDGNHWEVLYMDMSKFPG